MHLRRFWIAVALLGMLLGAGLVGTATFLLAYGSHVANTSGGTITRSVWFVHPTSAFPATVIVQDAYASPKPGEEFTLVVHGLGAMMTGARGATWARESRGVQVEIFGNVAALTGAEGYNAEFRSMEPYLKATLADRGSARCLWLAVATTGGQVVPVVANGSTLTVNGTLRIHQPPEPGGSIMVESRAYPGTSVAGRADLVVEGTGGEPFLAAANYANASGGALPRTFEVSGAPAVETGSVGTWTTPVPGNATGNTTGTTTGTTTGLPLPTLEALELALQALPATTPGPWLYVSEANRTTVEMRVAGVPDARLQATWEVLERSAGRALAFNFSDPGIAALRHRAGLARDLGFHAWVTRNATEAAHVARLMGAMDAHVTRIAEDPKMLHHGIQLADYVLGWDFAQALLPANASAVIADDIREYAAFVLDFLPGCGTNNWELVVSSGAGLAGLKLHDPALVHAALEKLEHYLAENVRAEGGIYEGQGYIGYAFDSYKRFLVALVQNAGTGLPNYFHDARLQAVYQFATRCATPDGFFPLFEDANPGASGARNGFVLAPFFHRAGEAQLARELVWLAELQGLANDTRPALERLLFGDYGIPATPPTIPLENFVGATYTGASYTGASYTGASYVAPDSGLVAFRTDWTNSAAYLTATAKTYPQSHDHHDEFSFEFWAGGQKLLACPGYPGWGKEHHDWTQTTEAANGGVLFSGQGQARETCAPGIVQWLRGARVDYLQLEDHHLYDTRWQSFVREEDLWALALAYPVAALLVGPNYVIFYEARENGPKRKRSAETSQESP